VAHGRDVIAAIEQTLPSMHGRITFEEQPLPLPAGFDDTALVSAIGSVPDTPLADGVAATITHFQQALAAGKIAPDNL
jgi:hypothetical protein